MLLQGKDVVDIQPYQTARAFTTDLLTRAPVADDENVLPEFAQDNVVPACESFSDCRKNHDRDDSPRDSKHREKTSHLVGFQVFPNLRQNDHSFSNSGNFRIVST